MVGGDDIIFPLKLERQISWLLNHPNAVLCGHGLQICDHNSIVTGAYVSRYPEGGVGRSKWIKYGPLYGATSIVVKKLFEL